MMPLSSMKGERQHGCLQVKRGTTASCRAEVSREVGWPVTPLGMTPSLAALCPVCAESPEFLGAGGGALHKWRTIKHSASPHPAVVPSKCWQLGDSEPCRAGCWELVGRGPGRRDHAIRRLRFSCKWVPSLCTTQYPSLAHRGTKLPLCSQQRQVLAPSSLSAEVL